MHVLALAVGLVLGCKKKDNFIMPSDFCYQGTVLTEKCSTMLIVQIANANIGETWIVNSPLHQIEGTFENTITISNKPDSILFAKGDKIYFNIDFEASGKTPLGCYEGPCLAIEDANQPKKMCIKYISKNKCGSNE